ncbi:putative trans-sialidase [Trypanosoma cruzi]|nr:putative trans-sialidase [Trypanosoma cruzi]
MLTTGAPSNPPPPTNPHRQRTAPSMLHPIFQIARRNRREGQWSLSTNDARLWYDETPAVPLWASYMRKAKEVVREMCAPSTWEQRMSLAGQFTTFCRTNEQPMDKESCAVFLMAIEVAPSTRLQYDRMLRSMLQVNGTPLDMAALRLQKVAVRSETRQTRQARPLTEEEMNQVICSRTDWKERVVVRLAWITASRLFEIAVLTPNNFALKADGALILDWSLAPKTARADPHRAFRFVRMRGQDALDTIKLCRTLQENEKLTNITNAKVERALAPWDAKAHSIERGALRHAAQIVETYNLNPHVISQLAKHVDPFDLPQNTVRYLWRYTTLLTQVSSLVALM